MKCFTVTMLCTKLLPFSFLWLFVLLKSLSEPMRGKLLFVLGVSLNATSMRLLAVL